ncbi:MAG: hypothetical protein AAF135_27315, partial [Bacteroidota bacterium]
MRLNLPVNPSDCMYIVRWDYPDLDAYRRSELFGNVWPKTKRLFSAKPLAYSLHQLEEVSLLKKD